MDPLLWASHVAIGSELGCAPRSSFPVRALLCQFIRMWRLVELFFHRRRSASPAQVKRTMRGADDARFGTLYSSDNRFDFPLWRWR